MRQVLIIFAKNERYGQVKTRLAATLGHEVAMSVYQQLLRHTCEVTSMLPVKKIVFYSDYIAHDDLWSAAIYDKKIQYGEDLGQRMKNAFATVFDEGAEQVVIIGTDCPELSSAIILEAFAQLNGYDVVIGPAKDGGYYLLAMKAVNKELFRNVDWSTGVVLRQTLAICEKNELSVSLLPELSDIDNEQDLISAKINRQFI